MKISHLNRVYINSSLVKNQILTIQDSEFHYLKSVLRLKDGQIFRIFNEHSGEFIAQITKINKNNLTVVTKDKIREIIPEKSLILGLAIIKPERFTEAIKAATSLGVTKIIPIISERSQYRTINYERAIKCIIEATEQSERLCPPELSAVMTLSDFCMSQDIEQIIFASESEIEDNLISKIKYFSNRLAVLIGPEGGFSAEEDAYVNSISTAQSISLGNTVLRSEIASTAAIACIKMMRG
jgi:16S rRNA (uracil1498-N3)-methyltransferase